MSHLIKIYAVCKSSYIFVSGSDRVKMGVKLMESTIVLNTNNPQTLKQSHVTEGH